MRGKNLLVTGGSGFLGKALLPRIVKDNRVTVLARNEGNLLALKQQFPSIHLITGDVGDPFIAAKAAKNMDGIFHLAGYKHVTLAEANVQTCLKTNVTGTSALLHATVERESRPEFIIGTSTDKAAQVAGTYGASKMIMERLFKEFERHNELTKYRIVRYGNVLYSTGSVLCFWKEALLNGKPVKISDPEATRFYWTVDSAVDLLFECLERATDATPYVPQMKAMRLGDILIAMEEKYGQAVHVETIGLKAGENKHERILEGGPSSDQVPRYNVEDIIKMV